MDKTANQETKAMWQEFIVTLQMTGKLAASLPRTKEEILQMLQNRMPLHPPENFIPVEELAEEVAATVPELTAEQKEAMEPAEMKYGWATFPRNDTGLYYEGRCIRGHLNLLGVR